MVNIHETGSLVYGIDHYAGMDYLVIQDFENIPKRKFLGMFGKGYKKTLVNKKMYPIDIPLYSLLNLYTNVEKTGESADVFEGAEPIEMYETIEANDNHDFKKDLEKMYKANIEMLGANSKLDFTKLPKNKLAKGFMSEGYHDYIVDLHNTLFRTYYLYRTARNGVLYVAIITEVGNYTDRDNNRTSGADILALDYETVDKIIEYMTKENA